MSSASNSASHPVQRQRPRRQRRGGNGFTLVEMLVVVGILVIIAGILIPVVGRARGQADKVKCVNQLKNLGQAIIAFEGEHNASLPTCGLDKPTYPTSTDWIGWGGMDTTNGRNTDYMNESGLAKYLGTSTLDNNGQPNAKLRSYYRCPSVTEDQRSVGTGWTFQYDYAFNAQLSGLPLEKVERASEKGLLIESDAQNDSAFTYFNKENIALRHKGSGANCLYADGHVADMDPSHVGTASPDDALAFTHWDAYYTQGSPPTATQKQNDPTKAPAGGTYGVWQ